MSKMKSVMIRATKFRLLEPIAKGEDKESFDTKGMKKEILGSRLIERKEFDKANKHSGESGIMWEESKIKTDDSKDAATAATTSEPVVTTVDVKGKQIEREALIEAMGEIGFKVNKSVGVPKLQGKFNALDEEKQVQIIEILKAK